MWYINERKASFDGNILSVIQEKQNQKEIKSLIEDNCLWNVSDTSGNTLLHFAAESDNGDIAKFLIECGSKVDAQNGLGKTPLMLAIEKKHKKMVKILLKAGADLEVCDDCNRNVLRVVIENYEAMDDDIVRIIFKKIQRDCFNNEQIANRLLYAGWPVYCIVLLGDAEVTKSILERDCSINTYYTQSRRKALMQAIETTVEEDICELLQSGSRKAAQRFPIVQEEHHMKTESQVQRKLYYDHDEVANFELFRMKKQWKFIALKYPGTTNLSLETQYAVACTVDYLLYDGTDFNALIGKNCLPIHRAFKRYAKNDEVFKTPDTILGVFLKLNFFIFGELLLAYLALYEVFGTPIPERLSREINANNRLKYYFSFCKRLLSKKVYQNVTLLKLLTEDLEKLTYLAYDQEFIKVITRFNRRLKFESYYFHISLQKRMEKIFMRTTAADVLCQLMNINYCSFPNIADIIFSYLTDQDVIRLWNFRHIVLRPGRNRVRRILPGFSFRIDN